MQGEHGASGTRPLQKRINKSFRQARKMPARKGKATCKESAQTTVEQQQIQEKGRRRVVVGAAGLEKSIRNGKKVPGVRLVACKRKRVDSPEVILVSPKQGGSSQPGAFEDAYAEALRDDTVGEVCPVADVNMDQKEETGVLSSDPYEESLCDDNAAQKQEINNPKQHFLTKEAPCDNGSGARHKDKVVLTEAEGPALSKEDVIMEAVALLRRRLVGVHGVCQTSGQSLASEAPVREEAAENEKKLYALLEQTVDREQNSSTLLLGPRGCGKSLVLERVLISLEKKYPHQVSPVRLSGLLHADDRSAFKEIARQLCLEHRISFPQASTFNDNLHFLIDVLKECVRAQKAIIFVLDEFDLFANKPKQAVLYTLLDALQSVNAQAAVVGLSCRQDAHQLLEKRIRSRFSHRRLLFLPPAPQDSIKLLQDLLHLPSTFKHQDFSQHFNSACDRLLQHQEMKNLVNRFCSCNLNPTHLVNLAFRALCLMDQEKGTLTLQNFRKAELALSFRPKLAAVKGASVLELYLLVALKRLEGQGRASSNFSNIFEEYDKLRSNHQIADCYSRDVALRAFEYLLERELITFSDGRTSRQALTEYRPVRLLVTESELQEGLKMHPSSPDLLKKWFAKEHLGSSSHVL